MASAASAAIQQASGLTSLQVPQGLPQGSILVVPSSTVLQGGGGTAGFSGVPLLLANTAVIVPQNIQTQPPLSSSQFTASQMSELACLPSNFDPLCQVESSSQF